MSLLKPNSSKTKNIDTASYNMKKSLIKEFIVLTVGFILTFIFLFAFANFLFSDTMSSSTETKEKLINDYISYSGDVQNWVSDYNIDNIGKEQKETKKMQLQAIKLEARFTNYKDTSSSVYLSKISQNTSNIKFLISSILATNNKNEILVDLNKLKAITG